jgi:hypothetical protein
MEGLMAYRLKTFQVQFVAEPVEHPAGSPCRSSEDAERVARAIYRTLDADKEHFLLLAIWRAPLHLCAAGRFVHNHPSGDPAPSPEDQELTRRLKETGDMLGIRVLDHVVLGDGRMFSFSDRGLL